jgi:hypothetical protein
MALAGGSNETNVPSGTCNPRVLPSYRVEAGDGAEDVVEAG